MAKNKNRKQGSHHDRASAPERRREEAEPAAYEPQNQPGSQDRSTPSDVARKHRRRFGHN